MRYRSLAHSVPRHPGPRDRGRPPARLGATEECRSLRSSKRRASTKGQRRSASAPSRPARGKIAAACGSSPRSRFANRQHARAELNQQPQRARRIVYPVKARRQGHEFPPALHSYLVINCAEILQSDCASCGERFASTMSGEKLLVVNVTEAEPLHFCAKCGENIMTRVQSDTVRERYSWDWAIPLRALPSTQA